MSWTDERVEKLKEYWAEGMSASQIAKHLGGVTRNAVIGKVHRLGLSHRAPGDATPEDAPAAEPPEPAAAEAPAAEPGPAPAAPVADGTAPADGAEAVAAPPGTDEEEGRLSLAEIEKMARKLDLLDLTERTCKWPIGDPAKEGFHFCGLPTVTGKPYCEHHVEVAFQPVSTRRDRSRGAR